MSLGKALIHFSLLMLFGLLWTLSVWPQETAPTASPDPMITFNWDKAINAAERLGICIVGIGVIAYVLYRQNAIETVTKRYDETATAHLAAFKEINERNMTAFTQAMEGMRELAEDNRSLAVSCTQINTTVAAKLEQFNALMMKERPG